MAKKLFALPAGILPKGNKVSDPNLYTLPLFSSYVVPLSDTFSAHYSRPCVAIGDHVLKYQKLSIPQDALGTATHAPTSGTITEIGPHPSAHISGLNIPCITISSDGTEHSYPAQPFIASADKLHSELCEHLQHMGVVGLGGAMFPAHRKLNSNTKPDTLIINAAECEPYISCDDALLRHHAHEVLHSACTLAQYLQISQIIIGIEDNKAAAADLLSTLIHQEHYPIRCERIPSRYPSGSAKQLSYILTGKKLAYGQHLSEAGILCFNPGTLLAIGQAIKGYPLIERITTLAGDHMSSANYRVLIGTRLSDVLAERQANPSVIVLGGSLMGYPLPHAHIPIDKGHNCFLLLDKVATSTEMPCIRCGDCARVCPVSLQPQELYWYARGGQLQKAQDYALFDCIECNACSYVCPSHIPLVSYYQYAKHEIRETEHIKKEAEAAKQRFEERETRLERKKQERLQKLQSHSQQLMGSDEEKRKLVQSAIQRIQEKKRLDTPPVQEDPRKE